MRIENVVDTTLRKEHWVGFRRGPERNNWAYIHSRDHDSLYGALILEQSKEWQRNIYINFVDFEKEFDSVHWRKKLMESATTLRNPCESYKNYQPILK